MLKRYILPVPVIVALIAGGCVIVSSDEWKKLQQDMSDLKRESGDMGKAIEALKLQAEEIQKTTAADLSSRMSSMEKKSSESDKEIRKKQADTMADLMGLKSEFQVLTGRFEEMRYSNQKVVKEAQESRGGMEPALKEIEQRLDELKKRIDAVEQSIMVMNQVKEDVKTSQPDQESAYKDAYETYQKEDFDSAREKFQKYLSIFPDSKYAENAAYWVGECYYSQKSFEKAIVQFDDVLKKYPNGSKAPAALLKQGMALSALGEKKSAEAIFKKLIQKYPKSEQAEVAKKRLKD